jgi:hypothetical protein
MKSALFVDFDNVYSGLRRLDPAAAERFAFQPSNWVRWLTEALESPPHAPDTDGRRLLVRRCYLNPQAYQRFRPAFNRAGFEIVDCPPMTSEGKTSTDIHMVLDTIDLLQHEVHYDEFIVFSADADFTPVLRKLRRWDRRTTVLAVGFPSAAYQASADLLIDQDEFIRLALNFSGLPTESAPPAVPASRAASEVVKDVRAMIKKIVAESPRPVSLASLASKAPHEVTGLNVADWANFGSFKKLVESLKLSPLVVDWELGDVRDPDRHAKSTPKTAQLGDAGRADDVIASVTQLIKSEVASAGRPVSCSRLAQLIVEQHDSLAADWGGKGSFRKLIDSLNLGQLKVSWDNGSGHISDPNAAWEPPEQRSNGVAQDWGDHSHLRPAVQQIHVATGMPLLSPKELQGLLAALANDVSLQPFALSDTGKRVRDRCKEAGLGVSRADVSYVLKGVLLGGHAFGSGDDNPKAFAKAFIGSMRTICNRDQVALDEATENDLLKWAAG